MFRTFKKLSTVEKALVILSDVVFFGALIASYVIPGASVGVCASIEAASIAVEVSVLLGARRAA